MRKNAIRKSIMVLMILSLIVLAGCAKKDCTQTLDSTDTGAVSETHPREKAAETMVPEVETTSADTEKSAIETPESTDSTDTASGEMISASKDVVLKDRPEDTDLIKNRTFYAQIPKNRYGSNFEEGDYAEGEFILWLNEVILSDSGEILERGKYAVPYIVSDNGNDENLCMLSGGLDGYKPYGNDIWKITTDEKGEIIDAEFELGIAVSIKRNQETGYFVEHNGKIYYRVPKDEAMKNSALFGEYMSGYCGPSEIKCYDLETGKSEKLCDSFGYGKLMVFNDSLVAKEKIHQNDEEAEKLVMISLEDGSSSVMDKYDLQEHMSLIYAMFDDYIIYEEDDYEKDEYSIYSLDYSNGNTIKLGQLDKLGETMYPGEPQQFYSDGENIWFTMSAYQGTGHFFSEARLYHAKVNTEGSLMSCGFDTLDTINRKPMSEEYGVDFCTEFNRAPGFVIRDREPIITEGEPGTASVIYDSGVLMYYDNNGLRNDIASGYETFESGEEGTRTNIELSEYVGDHIFLVRNEEWRDEANDVGWREAYVRKFSYIVVINPQTGEETIIDYTLIPLE